MKNILNLTGIQKLTKEEQKGINGSWGNNVYCGGPRQCCQTFNQFEYCDYGYCNPNGSCTWA